MPRITVPLTGLICLALQCCALAQGFPRSIAEQPDSTVRNDQRLLETPVGQPSVLEQIEWLERMSNLASNAQPPAPLTDGQLRTLDHLMKNFVDDSGTPRLDMIPPGLLNGLMESVLNDPARRQQARRLLEQYARQRNLKLPGSQPGAPSLPAQSRSNDPFNQSAGNPNRASSNPGMDDPNRTGSAGQPTAPSIDPSLLRSMLEPSTTTSSNDPNRRPQSSPNNLPSGVRPETGAGNSEQMSPDKLRALEELVKQLHKLDESRQKAAKSANDRRTSPSSSSAAQSRNPRPRRPGETAIPAPNQEFRPKSRQLQPPFDPRQDPNRFAVAPPLPNTFPPMPATDYTNGDSQSQAESSTQLAENQTDTQLPLESNQLNLGEFDPLDPFNEKALAQKPNQPAGSGTNPFEDGSSRKPSQRPGNRGFQVKELSKQLPPSDASAASTTNRSVENNSSHAATAQNSNWRNAFRGLVDKVMKEQGHDTDSAKNLLREAASEFKLMPASNQSNASRTNTNAEATPQDPFGLATNQVANKATTGGPANAATTSPGNNGWNGLAKDLWKAISEPTQSIQQTASGASRSAAPSTTSFWQSFNSQTAALLLAVGLATAALFWFARRRLAVVTADAAEQTRWVRQSLAQGLRTRADVVRAFHRFALRASHPVSNWWNHRQAARRLSLATPPLAVAIEELAGLYEQARYLPPGIELSDQQLERVQLALQQCISGSDKPAKA